MTLLSPQYPRVEVEVGGGGGGVEEDEVREDVTVCVFISLPAMSIAQTTNGQWVELHIIRE